MKYKHSHPCELCKKISGDHNGITKACPIGRKHRNLGYTQYHNNDVFTPKPGWKQKEQDIFKL